MTPVWLSTTAHSYQPIYADVMWERYAWFAFPAFGLSAVAATASYIWDSDFLWWPALFALLGCAAMFPLVVVRPFLAILEALRHDDPSEMG
jgi:hypothetical protein